MAEQNISPEQLKALQEKIKQMSPEELKEFQKKQCIFCQIVSGKVQSRKIYEDDTVFAILDINPANPGHALLLTKEHYSIMPQVPDEDIAHVFMVAKALSNHMLRSIDAHGTNIIVSNGIVAGQRAQHFMVHIIPRKENDGVNFTLPQKTMEQNEIESIGNRLIAALSGAEKEEEKPQIKMPETQETLSVSGPTKSEGFFRTKKKEEAKKGIDLDEISKLLGVK